MSNVLDGRTVIAVARRVGLTERTVRLYARTGVVTPAERSKGGYKLYSPAEEEELRIVARARAVGVGLDECRLLLAKRRTGAANVKGALEGRLAAVERARLRLSEAIGSDA